MDVEPFLDNWTYLRTELNWLDRMLAAAVARQRKETKEVDRVSRSRADQVTSHWWKGLITVEGEVAGDSPVEVKGRTSGTKTHQQQIEARIRISHQQGRVLGLPKICQRLQLSTFEKNLVLMALAPEMSQRYGRIYAFLQEADHSSRSGLGLPTVDLILRLLCRNDEEWRKARLLLTEQSALIQHQVIQLSFSSTESFLAHPVKLSDSLVEYLLAEQPDEIALDRILQVVPPLNEGQELRAVESSQGRSRIPAPPPFDLGWATEPIPPLVNASPVLLQLAPEFKGIADPWAGLVLPGSVLLALRQACDRVKFADAVHQIWGEPSYLEKCSSVGTILLLAGASGTGKTTAGCAISHTLDAPFYWVDLASISPCDYSSLLSEIASHTPQVLMVKAAHHWFGRKPTLSSEQLRQFFALRRQCQGVTLLSVERKERILPTWQRQVNQILEFPFPNQESRQRLWQQVFPSRVSLEPEMDWRSLSQLKLSGGDIRAIARDATVYALAESATAQVSDADQVMVGMRHLRNAIAHLTNQR
jgi:hypothetical protein